LSIYNPLSSNFIGIYSYTDNKCTNLIIIDGTIANLCIPQSNTTSKIANCYGNQISGNIFANINCQGTPVFVQNGTGGCAPLLEVPGQYSNIACGGSCFHEETVLKYKEETLTLDSLKQNKHASCHSPHTYYTEGVKVSTNCNNTLRLTKDHLVYTQRGLIQAGLVVRGDRLFKDERETASCFVERVESEGFSNYFALNCEESVVLADGYKTSTFGTTHLVPSLWMKYISKFIGVRAASILGDYLVSTLKNWNIL